MSAGGYFSKPNVGDPVHPFVSDTALWSVLIDIIGAWNRGEIQVGTTAGRKRRQYCTLIGQNRDPDETYLAGTLHSLEEIVDPVFADEPAFRKLAIQYPQFFLRQLDFAARDWQLWLPTSVVLYRNIAPETQGPARSSRYVPAMINGLEKWSQQWSANQLALEGLYASPDPSNAGQLKAATAGIYRILDVFPDGTGILDTVDSQRLWRYKLTQNEARPNPGEYSMDLADPADNETFASAVNVFFPAGIDGSEGDSGYCLQAGKRFFALNTPSVSTAVRFKGVLQNCLKKCDSAGLVRVYDPNYDPPPSGDDGVSECGAGLNGDRGRNMVGGGALPSWIDFAGAAFLDLAINNRWRKHAVTGSAVTIEEWRAKDSSNRELQIMDVEDGIAEWIEVQKTGETWTFTGNYFDGSDPSICGTPTITGTPDPCYPDGTIADAWYRPKDDSYKVIDPKLPLEKEYIPIGGLYVKDEESPADDPNNCRNTYYQNIIQKTFIKCDDNEPGTVEQQMFTFDLNDYRDCICWITCHYCGHESDNYECTPRCQGNCYYIYDGQDWIVDTDQGTGGNDCTPDVENCGCPDPSQVTFPPNPSLNDTHTVPCGDFPPPVEACCALTKTMRLFDWVYSGQRAVADPDSQLAPGDLGRGLGSITKISDCEFEVTLHCFEDGQPTAPPTVTTRVIWARNATLCSNPEPDDGAWTIQFGFPTGGNWQARGGCSCCNTLFNTGDLLEPGGTIIDDLTCIQQASLLVGLLEEFS